MLRPIRSKSTEASLVKAMNNLSLDKKKSIVQKVLEDMKEMHSNSTLSQLDIAKMELDRVTAMHPKAQQNRNLTWLQKKYKAAQKLYKELLHKKEVSDLCTRGNTLSLK